MSKETPIVKSQRREERISRGVCPDHPTTPLKPGRRSCDKCGNRRIKMRKQSAEQGMCHNHKNIPVMTGKSTCFGCHWRVFENRLNHRYGITLEDFARMEYAQERKCALHSEHCLYFRGLYVDHNHETGKVRGLLCHRCNMIAQHPDVVERVLKYLRRRK